MRWQLVRPPPSPLPQPGTSVCVCRFLSTTPGYLTFSSGQADLYLNRAIPSRYVAGGLVAPLW